MKLCIATTNPAKFEEARLVLQGGHFEVFGLRDFSGIATVEETGATFEENAILKARGYFSQIGIPCIADDGGLEVEYLDGEPGVASSRWLGEEATDEDRANAVLKKLAGVPPEKRKARLGGFMVFYDGAHILKSENWVEGHIAERLMGEITRGFPYRPIFTVSQFGKSYNELTSKEYEQINFRHRNLNALIPEIIKMLNL